MINYMIQTAKRQSNFELLRVLSMLMIVIHHYAYHGQTNLQGEVTATTVGLQLLTIGGNLGVNIFVLIGSYFLVDKEFDWKRPLKIILDVILYSYLILAVYAIFAPQYLHGTTLLQFLLPFPETYWFAGYYVLLLFFVPAFNYFINQVSAQSLRYTLFFATVFLIIGPTMDLYYISIEFNRLLVFMYLYFLAAYAKLYMSHTYDNARFGRNLFIVSYVVLVVAILLSTSGADWLGVDPEVNNLVGMNKIFIMTAAIGLFLWAKNTSIPYNKLINTISGATFGIYLIHEQPLIRNSLWTLFDNRLFQGVLPAYLGGIMMGTIVFILCLLVALLVDFTLGRATTKLANYLSGKFDTIAASL